MRFSLAFIVLFICSCHNSQKNNSGQAAIEELMKQQVTDWNRGDIEAFMKPYWQSDSLIFMGKKGISYGWNNTLINYKKNYPNQEAMGKLEFNNKEWLKIDPDHYWLAGEWKLYRTNDTLGGHYSLLWKNIDGTWKIISDHSS
jgi:ketosteroid isomerase-like protein